MYRFDLLYGFQLQYETVVNQDVYAEVITQTFSFVLYVNWNFCLYGKTLKL